MTSSLSSAALSIELDDASGRVRSIVHRRLGLALIAEPASSAPFVLELDGRDEPVPLVDARVERVGDALRTTWTTDQGITIVGEVRLRGDDLAFTVDARNEGTATIRRLTYPVLAGIGRLGGRGLDELAHTHGTGMLFHDPFDLLAPDPGNERKLGRSPYPEGFAGATMQFFAYYARGSGGFLVGTEDAGRSMKWLDVERDAAGLTFSVIHKPAEPGPGRSFAPAYPVVVAALDEGSWTAAGDRYRRWALDQAWASPRPRSRWLREDVGVCTFGISSRNDRSGWLDAIHTMAGTPVFHVLGPDWAAYGQDYRGHLPRGARDWFPARFAAANLETIRRNGDRWAPFEFDLLCSDPADDVEPVLASRYAMDDAESGTSDGGLPAFPFMCPGTRYWHDLHVERDARLVREHGPDALYYDIAVNNVLLQCYAAGHDDAPGAGDAAGRGVPGHVWRHERRDARGPGRARPGRRRDDQRAVPAGLRLLPGPRRVGAVRALRGRRVPRLDHRRPGREESLFTYVYGERAPLRMDGWAKLSAVSGELFYWTAATVLLNGGLFEVNAEFSALETLADGRWDDPAEHYYPFTDRREPVDPDKAAYLGRVAATRIGPANPFLARGAMVPAPVVETEAVELDYAALNMSTSERAYEDRGTMTVPGVLATGWQLDDRRLWLAANLSAAPRTCRIDGREVTLGATGDPPDRGLSVACAWRQAVAGAIGFVRPPCIPRPSVRASAWHLDETDFLAFTARYRTDTEGDPDRSRTPPSPPPARRRPRRSGGLQPERRRHHRESRRCAVPPRGRQRHHPDLPADRAGARGRQRHDPADGRGHGPGLDVRRRRPDLVHVRRHVRPARRGHDRRWRHHLALERAWPAPPTSTPADCITFDGWITDGSAGPRSCCPSQEARQRRDDGHPDVRLRGQRRHVPPLHVGPALGRPRVSGRPTYAGLARSDRRRARRGRSSTTSPGPATGSFQEVSVAKVDGELLFWGVPSGRLGGVSLMKVAEAGRRGPRRISVLQRHRGRRRADLVVGCRGCRSPDHRPTHGRAVGRLERVPRSAGS